MVEFIGFIISLLALLYLFISQNRASQRRAYPPSPIYSDQELEEEGSFEELMKAVEKEVSKKEAAQRLPPSPPPSPRSSPPPKVIKKPPQKTSPLEDYRLASQIETRKIKSSLENRHFQSKFNHHEELPRHTFALPTRHHLVEEDEMKGPSRIQLAVQRLANRRDMIIYQEILDKPKSMRSMHP